MAGKDKGSDPLVADNKNLTAAPPNQPPAVDPQTARPQPMSTDPSNQPPGGANEATFDSPASHAEMSGMEKLKAYVESYLASSPSERVIFGHAHIRITMGDLRDIVGADTPVTTPAPE